MVNKLNTKVMGDGCSYETIETHSPNFVCSSRSSGTSIARTHSVSSSPIVSERRIAIAFSVKPWQGSVRQEETRAREREREGEREEKKREE